MIYKQFCRVHPGEPDNSTTAMVLYSDNSEAVEWVNMCWRKVIGCFTCCLQALCSRPHPNVLCPASCRCAGYVVTSRHIRQW